MQPPRRYTFGKDCRIRARRAFEAVYERGRRATAGPLLVVAVPNDLGHPRLGLSVPRRVGSAVKRNRIKRLLREAFRLMQHDLPRGYDVVVNVRPHDPLALAAYQRLLFRAMRSLHAKWMKDAGQSGTTDAGGPR